jgi:hypothetical protein
VCDCKKLACVIATRELCVIATWLFGIWLQAWVVCDCKICWFISVTAKKEKEKLNKCVIATIWRPWLQTRSYVCCKKTWLCLCACKATWLFGIWLHAWIVRHCKKLKCVIAQPACVCDCKKLKCVIAKSAGLFLWLQKRKRKTKQVCDCNYLACVIANQELCVLQKNLTLSVCLQSYLVVWNMIASLDSVSLQKTKVCDCTPCFYEYSWCACICRKK